MFKKIILIIIIINSISIFNLLANVGSALEGAQQLVDENRNKSTNYSKGITHFNKAVKLEKKNKIKKSEKYYEKAINYFIAYHNEYGVYPETLYYIGFSYEKIHDVENAILFYQISLTLDPKNIKANKQLAEIYLKKKNFDLVKNILKVLKDCNCEEYNIINEKVAKN